MTARDLDLALLRRLKARAAQSGRSAETEHRAILESVLGTGAGDLWVEAARLRERTRGRNRQRRSRARSAEQGAGRDDPVLVLATAALRLALLIDHPIYDCL